MLPEGPRGRLACQGSKRWRSRLGLDPTSSVQIKADGVTLENLNLTAPSDGPRDSAPEQDEIFVASARWT